MLMSIATDAARTQIKRLGCMSVLLTRKAIPVASGPDDTIWAVPMEEAIGLNIFASSLPLAGETIHPFRLFDAVTHDSSVRPMALTAVYTTH
jgi:hypothetical protein